MKPAKKTSPTKSNEATQKWIHIHGAKENNLKNVHVDIPLHQLTVVTGLSGSGKSSLVMDVLYAEAQRKFAESMTSYARQFLSNAKKPAVEYIKGLSPAIAISQHKFSSGSRSTIGTATEIHDYLRLLFGRIGKITSPKTGKELKAYQAIDIVEECLNDHAQQKAYITFSLPCEKQIENQLAILNKKGFTRWLDATTMHIDSIEEPLDAVKKIGKRTSFDVLVDRVMLSPDQENRMRLIDSVKIAVFEGRGEMNIFLENGTKKTFTTRLEEDGIKYMLPSPSLFSFNNSLGICKTCEGYGTVLGIDPHLVIPDPKKSVYDGAVAPWKGEKMSNYLRYFIEQSATYKFPVHRPIKDLTPAQLDLLWKGNQDVQGINDFFEEVKRNTYKIQYRVLLSRYQGKTACPECAGHRLCREALCIQVGGKHIGELSSMSIGNLQAWLENRVWTKQEWETANKVIEEIKKRVDTLIQVGLNYLTLHRTISTLSGGESQRVQLTKFIGSNLTQSLYILDEPSIGLHEKDTSNLIAVLRQLRDLGNTVVVVEHDENIIRSADYIIDMGPLAGSQGGNIVTAGNLQDVLQSESLTADYLTKKKQIQRTLKTKLHATIAVEKASLFNVNQASISFPLNALTVVHGPSGAGKSTLINKITYPAICKHLNISSEFPLSGTYERIHISHPSYVEEVEWISQQSISRLSRSNPISYTKAYDDIRALFAQQSMSKQNFLTAGSFSFNSPGGRCEECKGEGIKTVEMQFLPDIELICDTCKGQRFTETVLQVKVKGMSIMDVLHLTVDDAVTFFQPYPKIEHKIRTLQKVGLGYVQLGQSTSTLSGGELQRLKLAAFLSKTGTKPTLFFFDEPTVGLHFDDVRKLVIIFDELIAKGHTVVIIEHNPDIIRTADWLIELGPEAGEKGGQVIYCGKGGV